MFEHGELRVPSMVSWFSKRAPLGLRLHQPQALVADDEDARGERRPIAAKPLSCHGIRGSHTGARDEHRLVRPERIGGQGPHDLRVTRLVERSKFLGRKRMERHNRFPGLRDGSDHDLAIRDLGEHSPPDRERLGQQTAGAVRKRLAAQEGRQRPQHEDPSHHGRVLDVELMGHREGCRRRRTHPDAVAFIHLWAREEPIEEVVAGESIRVHAPVPRPRHSGVGGVRDGRRSDGGAPVPEAPTYGLQSVHHAIPLPAGAELWPKAWSVAASRSARALMLSSSLRIITMSPVVASIT